MKSTLVLSWVFKLSHAQANDTLQNKRYVRSAPNAIAHRHAAFKASSPYLMVGGIKELGCGGIIMPLLTSEGTAC